MVKIKVMGGTMTVTKNEWYKLRELFYRDMQPRFENGLMHFILCAPDLFRLLKDERMDPDYA